MSFISDLSNLGNEILDTTTEIVDSLGVNIGNRADADALKIKAAETNIAIAKQKFLADQAQKERLQNLFEGVVYVLMGLLLVYTSLTLYKKFK